MNAVGQIDAVSLDCLVWNSAIGEHVGEESEEFREWSVSKIRHVFGLQLGWRSDGYLQVVARRYVSIGMRHLPFEFSVALN